MGFVNMIFKFADNQGLTFAYAELLDAGIAKSSISACFDEPAATPLAMADHQSFLQRLHAWFIEIEKDMLAGNAIPAVPASPVFRHHGGTLEVKSTGRETEIIAIALHHYGEMVG